MLKTREESIEEKICLVSGSGNVAQFTIEKINQMGGKAVTLSDSSGKRVPSKSACIGKDAQNMINQGVYLVSEGANMPCAPEAIKTFREEEILHGPGKAANAGGVAVSGLEMSQNSIRLSWTTEEVDQRLQQIMKNIHAQCFAHGMEGNYCNYFMGANIAGFKKVADAMVAQGIV